MFCFFKKNTGEDIPLPYFFLSAVFTFLIILIFPADTLGLAPKSSSSLEQEFSTTFNEQFILGLAFPNSEDREIFEIFVESHNPELKIQWEPNSAEFHFASQSNRLILGENISFRNLLDLEDQLYNERFQNIWSADIKTSRPIKSNLVLSIRYLFQYQEVSLKKTANDLALILYQLLYQKPIGAQERLRLAKPLQTEEIKEAESFLFKSPEDINRLITIFKKNPSSIHRLIRERYEDGFIQNIEQTGYKIAFDFGLDALNDLKISQMGFAFRQHVLSALIAKIRSKEKNENGLIRKVYNSVLPFVGGNAFSISDILKSEKTQCFGSTLLAGKVFKDLGYQTYWCDVIENIDLVAEYHACLLIESKEHPGEYFLFDPAMRLEPKNVVLPEEFKRSLKRIRSGETILLGCSVSTEQRGKLTTWSRDERRTAAEGLFQGKHPFMQIRSYEDGAKEGFLYHLGEYLVPPESWIQPGTVPTRHRELARKIYRNLVSQKSKNPLVLSCLAGILGLEKVDLEESLKLFDQALILSPGNPIVMRQKAMILINNNRFKEALILLEDVAQYNDEPLTLLNLGLAYVGEGKKQQAQKTLQELKNRLGNDHTWVSRLESTIQILTSAFVGNYAPDLEARNFFREAFSRSM